MGRLVAFALCLVSCQSADPKFEDRIDVFVTTAVEDRLVVVDRGRSSLRLLDVSGQEAPAAPRIVPIVGSPVLAERRRGHDDQLLVLSQGHPDDGAAEPEKPGLTVVGKDGPSTSFRYDSAFDGLVQSEDGSRAFLFFRSKNSAGGSLLFNPNQIGVVDLTSNGGAPAVRTLDSFGSSPHGAAFSPPMTIAGVERHFAVALFNAEISIMDLDHIEDPAGYPAYTVGLTRAGSHGVVTQQILFSPTEPKIYVRASGSNDVFVVTLSPDPDGAAQNDFKPSVNQMDAGVTPSDMALFQGDDGRPRLLVVSPGSSQALVIDSDSSNVTSVPLPRPAERIHLFEGGKPSDPEPKPRALLYSVSDNVVTFLDLPGLEDRLGQNAELLSISTTYSNVLPLNDNIVMLLHSTSGLSLVDLSDRTLVEISGPNLSKAVWDPAVQKLWLAPNDSTGRIGLLDLAAGFAPAEVRLDAPVRSIVSVPSPTRPRLVAIHESGIGRATVLDANAPTDLGAAFAVRGYLVEGVLGGGR